MRQVLEAFRHAREVNREKGFTLIELLVVIAIIAILAAIAVPQFNKYRANAALSNVQNLAKQAANLAVSLGVVAGQNPSCAGQASFRVITNTSDAAANSAAACSGGGTCYLVAQSSNTTKCDSSQFNMPNWVTSFTADLTVGAGTSTGSIQVESNYQFGGKTFGCSYDVASGQLSHLDAANNKVCGL